MPNLHDEQPNARYAGPAPEPLTAQDLMTLDSIGRMFATTGKAYWSGVVRRALAALQPALIQRDPAPVLTSDIPPVTACANMHTILHRVRKASGPQEERQAHYVDDARPRGVVWARTAEADR